MPSDLFRAARVQLASLSKADIPTIAAWYRDAEFSRLFDAAPAYPRTEAALAQWLEDTEKASDSYLFGVRLVDGGALIGYTELNGIQWANQSCWLALAIGDRDNWGKGYGSEAAQLALAYAFRELNMHRVQLTVFAYNQRAIALYERLGFRREGVYRAAIQRDGQRHDMYLYGLLRQEWKAS